MLEEFIAKFEQQLSLISGEFYQGQLTSDFEELSVEIVLDIFDSNDEGEEVENTIFMTFSIVDTGIALVAELTISHDVFEVGVQNIARLDLSRPDKLSLALGHVVEEWEIDAKAVEHGNQMIQEVLAFLAVAGNELEIKKTLL